MYVIDKIHEQFEALKKIFAHLKYEYSKGCEIPSSEIYNLLVDRNFNTEYLRNIIKKIEKR